eukprot:2056903-Prorocentrum_lima.AAC.1
MKQLQGQVRRKLRNQVGGYQGEGDKGLFHEPYQNFKFPAGPVPEPGFRNPINNFKPPTQGP